jgi:hypothetical protein
VSVAVKILATLVAAYVVIALAAWLGQRRMIYVPNPMRYSPTGAGLAYAQEQVISTPDGARIVAWRIAAREGQPTILYFHGNAGGLVNRAARAQRYASRGFGMLLMSYRGYSGSTGSPSEAANLADARQAYDLLIRDGVAARDIFVYGESLGSGIAVQIAAEKAVGGLILDAPYTSLVDMAQRRFPFLPVRSLLLDRYENDRHIKRVGVPVLILHGARDEVIPVAMGRALHAAANHPKRLVVFPAGMHTDLDEHGAVDVVADWIAEVRG